MSTEKSVNEKRQPALKVAEVSSSFYTDGIDYSHLTANSTGFDEEAEDGEFNGTCVNCGSENITITDEADICHECGFVYT